MNIAICDDDVQILGEIEKIIYNCYNGDTNLFLCDSFLSGEELLNHLKKEPRKYQIYILDIEMKQINGLQIASIIREEDYNAIIIFITSHKELMQEAFDIIAFHYLVKPINDEKVMQVLSRAIKLLNLKKSIFHFKIGKKLHVLHYEQIECFESNKRKIIIYTKENTYEYYEKIKELMKKLDLLLFVQVHNSFIVNMEYIKLVDGESIVLNTGKRIAITKKYYNNFNNTYRNFILMRVK